MRFLHDATQGQRLEIHSFGASPAELSEGWPGS